MILLDCEIVGAPPGIGDVFLEGDNLQTIDEDHSNYFINWYDPKTDTSELLEIVLDIGDIRVSQDSYTTSDIYNNGHESNYNKEYCQVHVFFF